MLCNEICESILWFIQDAIIHNCYDIRDKIGHNCFVWDIYATCKFISSFVIPFSTDTKMYCLHFINIFPCEILQQKTHYYLHSTLTMFWESKIYIVYIFCSEIMITMFSSPINTLHNENLWVKNVLCYRIHSDIVTEKS